MKYRQIDKITSLIPGQRITAERTLRGDEEHLNDHFPRFPVMPGVMMLEALHQAAVWMIRTGDDFESPLVLLKEVRSVKFGSFLSPDETLQITAEVIKTKDNLTTVKATAAKNGNVSVSARLIMESRKTGDPDHIGTDANVRRKVSEDFEKLFGKASDYPAAAPE